MAFQLNHAGGGCYSLVFRGEHIGSVFASDEDADEPWIATLHDHWAAQAGRLPSPFATKRHRFRTLQAVRYWLRGGSRRSGSTGEPAPRKQL